MGTGAEEERLGTPPAAQSLPVHGFAWLKIQWGDRESCKQTLTVPLSSLTQGVSFLPCHSNAGPSMWKGGKDMSNTKRVLCYQELLPADLRQSSKPGSSQLMATSARLSCSSVSADGGSKIPVHPTLPSLSQQLPGHAAARQRASLGTCTAIPILRNIRVLVPKAVTPWMPSE